MKEIAKLRWLLLCAAYLTVVGCHTMTFVQYEQPGEHKTINRWHHSTINGMVEISKPLNIETVCNKKAWTKITTEHTFLNGLTSLITPLTYPISLYSSWTNKVECYEPLATL